MTKINDGGPPYAVVEHVLDEDDIEGMEKVGREAKEDEG